MDSHLTTNRINPTITMVMEIIEAGIKTEAMMMVRDTIIIRRIDTKIRLLITETITTTTTILVMVNILTTSRASLTVPILIHTIKALPTSHNTILSHPILNILRSSPTATLTPPTKQWDTLTMQTSPKASTQTSRLPSSDPPTI